MIRLAVFAGVSLAVCLSACEGSPPPRPEAPPAPPRTAGMLIRQIKRDPSASIPGAGRVLTVSYLSTNGITGKGLVPVTGEVIYPAGDVPKGGWPIMAWEHGTVGIVNACAPSRNPRSARDMAYLAEWLHRGFAIVASDYQGLGSEGVHPYLNTRAEAYSVLDGIRAALKGLPDLENRIMLVGQSQGAGAAFAAAAYAPDYAPALDIRGTVATGIPYMTPAIAKALMQGAGHGGGKGQPDPVVAYALLIGASLQGYDPSFDPAVAFTPKALPALKVATEQCLPAVMAAVADDHLTRANSFEATLPQALAPALRSMAYPTLALKTPLFVGTGSKDIDVAPQGQLQLVADACKAGTRVWAHLYKGLDHSQTVMASTGDSAAFTHAVMSGDTVPSRCHPAPQ